MESNLKCGLKDNLLKHPNILEENAGVTVTDMLVQEKVGSMSQSNMDSELAKQIMTDGKFENNLEYMDNNAEKLGRRKLKSETMKRQLAINGRYFTKYMQYRQCNSRQIISVLKKYLRIAHIVTTTMIHPLEQPS